jgi:hypothetical protein
MSKPESLYSTEFALGLQRGPVPSPPPSRSLPAHALGTAAGATPPAGRVIDTVIDGRALGHLQWKL